MPFGRQYVWVGSLGTDFSDFHNWSPIFADKQAPGPDDLVIFNTGGTVVLNGHNGLVAEIDVVLGTTVTLQGGLEGSGTVNGVALSVDSDGAVIVGTGAEMIGIGAVDVIGFNGAGTVVVTAGGHMDDNGMVLGDRAGGAGTVTVDGAGSILVVANNLPGAPNGVLIVGNGGTGTLSVTNGGSLGSSFATLGEKVGSSGVATLNGAAWSGGLFTIGKAGAGSLAVQSAGVLTTVLMVIGGAGTLDVSGALGSAGTVLAAGITLAGGTVDLTRGGIIALSSALGTPIGPAGAMLVDTGSDFVGLGTFKGNVVLHDSGTLQATGAGLGTLALTGDISGTGTVEPLMTLDLNGTVAAGVAIAFAAPTVLQPGVLVLENAAGEGGTISGFAVGNTIELPGLHFTNAAFIAGTLPNPGTLILSGGTETPLSLAVTGGYGLHDFIATSDSSGTTVTLVPCFVSGTSIATDDGSLAVERLRIGMRVRTEFSGMAPVKWIGHRSIDCRRHPRPADVWPVRVRAHAFGDTQPRRDLWLSPDHAVFIDGVLIPVRYLINDATITQEARDNVTYWHVELEQHDLLSADGLACESYLDTGNRGAFANGGGAVQLHPDFARAVWRASSCAPLVIGGAELEAARSFLLARALSLGFALTDDPALRLVAGGQMLPAKKVGCRYHFDLGTGDVGSARLMSRCSVPAHIRDDSNDYRLLGVAVSHIAFDGQRHSLSGPRVEGAGWHDIEDGWRWTNGNAALALCGVGEVEIEVAIVGRYWRDDVDSPVTAFEPAPRARSLAR